MNEMYREVSLPFKSVAGALLFAIILGPVGLLYASVIGGVLLTLLFVAAVGNKYFIAAGVFWMLGCVWSVMAVNRFNKKIIKQ